MSDNGVELTLRLRDLNAAVSRGDDDARTEAWAAIKTLFSKIESRAENAEHKLGRVKKLREELANSKYDLEHIEILTRLDEALGVTNE